MTWPLHDFLLFRVYPASYLHYGQCAMPTPLALLEVDALDDLAIPGQHVYQSVERLHRLKPLIDPDTMLALFDMGLLFFHRWKGLDCWILTDRTEQCCAIRRLDGLPFRHGNKDMSAGPNWAIGLQDGLDAGYYKFIVCEGVTDTLAAWDVQMAAFSDWWPVCLRGASATVDPKWFPDDRSYRFLVCGDNDAAGRKFNRRNLGILRRFGLPDSLAHEEGTEPKADLYDYVGTAAGREHLINRLWVLDDSHPDKAERAILAKQVEVAA